MEPTEKNISPTTAAVSAKALLRAIAERLRRKKEEQDLISGESAATDTMLTNAINAYSPTKSNSLSDKGLLVANLPESSWLDRMSKRATVVSELKTLRDAVADAMAEYPIAKRVVTIGANGMGAAVAPDIVNGVAQYDYFNNKIPEVIEETPKESNIKALKALIKKIKQEKIKLVLGRGAGGPAYSGVTNSIHYDPYEMPLHAGILAHELGHAKVHNKLKKVLGEDVGGTVSTIGSGLIGNVASPIATTAAFVPALLGKTKASLVTGGIGSALMVPRLLDEGLASWWGKKFLDDNGLEGGDKAWSGINTYLASAAAPLAPGAGVYGVKKLLKVLSKGKAKM